MFKKKLIMVASVIALMSLVLTPCLALAFTEGDPDPSGLLETTADEAGFETGSGGPDQFMTIVGNVISILLSLLGVIFFVLLVYGGFLWMTSQGAEDKVKKAKTLITDAIIGLVIILAAYAISSFIISSLVTATLEQ